MRKSMTQFIACIAILFAIAAPAFYYLTKNYYAEDLDDLIEAVQKGQGIPAFDLEEDIMKGIMLQYLLITVLLGVGAVVMHKLMSKDIERFQAQKEFTENASHELQTPLAIFQAKLELLLQQPGLTNGQAEIIQDLFQMTSRLSRLNRNLLLLAKIDNKQFDSRERIRLDHFINRLLPSLESISGELRIERSFSSEPLYIQANSTLLESMLNNLIVNAVRHSNPGGKITISIHNHTLRISNTSDEPALSAQHIFNRFYRPTQNKGGNGLGLAIVKAICDYHGWGISYEYRDGLHSFIVKFT